MDNNQLQKLVEDISMKSFGKRFRHQASFNKRLRTTGGRYLLRSHNIDINQRYYEEFGLEELIGIIKHELCHYHLHLEGKGYQHRDRDFKELLAKVGAPRFCSPLKLEKVPRKILVYCCKSCSQKYTRRKRVNTTRYLCGKCGGKIQLIEEG
ncbi:SprT family protein [Metabacillus herbersteinensis]|uniref:Protein SprT-like n=1 Tax=Metabacillus herbersteinensis TaxID=283816 RepID=A0ABV6GL77_9BACI